MSFFQSCVTHTLHKLDDADVYFCALCTYTASGNEVHARRWVPEDSVTEGIPNPSRTAGADLAAVWRAAAQAAQLRANAAEERAAGYEAALGRVRREHEDEREMHGETLRRLAKAEREIERLRRGKR